MAHALGVETRIGFRVDPDQKSLIERGAEARGLSVSDYLKNLAIRDAEIALNERTYFNIGPEAFARFEEILERPVHPNPFLYERLQRSKKIRWKVRT